MSVNRRDFIIKSALAAGSLALPGQLQAGILTDQYKRTGRIKVSELKKPVAIAMWDFSWILRHHRYGEFEN